MRHFYGWATPNSQRVSIMLEECGLEYGVTGVNIRARQQFAPEILALNPYGKIPILVEDGRPIFESGSILLHLAERHGLLLGEDRATTLSWLMVALTSLGPFTGQAHHWTELAPEKPEAARAHTTALVDRVYRLLDARLAQAPYLAGATCSIADIAAYPWVAKHGWAGRTLDGTPNLAAWFSRMGERPAVQRGMAVPAGARLE
ncbi:glutathione S-transferase family protein [Falsiroseomonas sp. E2-1-a4]|uniref:glutathione S-transferase family protein n=1 Tax=Falsiroseomonas sp. E2-1-a4 TaxID=3239299 RepID=UPI003F2ADC43